MGLVGHVACSQVGRPLPWYLGHAQREMEKGQSAAHYEIPKWPSEWGAYGALPSGLCMALAKCLVNGTAVWVGFCRGHFGGVIAVSLVFKVGITTSGREVHCWEVWGTSLVPCGPHWVLGRLAVFFG
ncbi:hypothetical protein GH714_006041 [Hevea brasiliensis]|uniref:Uncharacterized protein n=1 Tax=Hevea brasiliensis TaxID=3981 RepID=A0A6A6L2R7_HEVBR|nr:hypothetical protein GH714_006041 [Hevea brasiliensis]